MKIGISLDGQDRLGLLMQHHASLFAAHIEEDRQRYEEWLPWTVKVRDEAGASAFIERFLQKLAARDGVLLGLWHGPKLCGGILLRSIDWTARRTEIGFWISSRHGGKGLMRRATEAMIDFVFDELDLNHVTLQAAVSNVRSRAVAERLGFVQEGMARAAALYPSGLSDHVLYGLLASEWRARQG